MLWNLHHYESPNTIDIQPLNPKPTHFMDSAPLSDDPSAGGGDGKRRRMSSDLSPEGGGFPEPSPESGGSPASTGGDAEGSNGSKGVPHGWVSVIGRRREMEDAVVVGSDLGIEEYIFSAVYDGHGGARVSNSCRDKLHLFLLEELKKEELNREVDWEKVMAACFKKMDDDVANCETDDEAEVGSTAAVVVIGREVVVVANCGDSRVVMCRGGDTVTLSSDHNLDRPDEKERVEASGGMIARRNGSRFYGVLTISRSIGDKYLKPFVTSDPEVTVTKRTESDQFLIIASHGLWNVVSNDIACDLVTKCFSGKLPWRGSEKTNYASEAAAKLAELAIAKGSKDNISVIVVELNKSS